MTPARSGLDLVQWVWASHGAMEDQPRARRIDSGAPSRGLRFRRRPTGSFSISGSIVGNSTATVNLAGAASASTTTDGAGHFTFGSLRNGTYVLTPSLAGYTFNPPTTTVTIDGTDVAGESFELCSLDAWCVNLAGPWFLTGVWGSSASDVWAVAENGGILGAAATLHFDGRAWSSVDLGEQAMLLGVWGSGPSDVLAVGIIGNGAILNWGGTSWAQAWYGANSTTYAWQELFGVWGSGPSDVWAVGWGETATEKGGSALHFDGQVWSNVANPAAGMVALNGVWGSGPSDVWVVGDAGTILHWDGQAFSSVANPTTGMAVGLVGVWGSGEDDVWAVGEAGTILHWDGQAWSSVANPLSGTQGYLASLWGAGATDAWAVGSAILHWDGTSWSEQGNPLSASLSGNLLTGVWGSAGGDPWAVGYEVIVHHAP